MCLIIPPPNPPPHGGASIKKRPPYGAPNLRNALAGGVMAAHGPVSLRSRYPAAAGVVVDVYKHRSTPLEFILSLLICPSYKTALYISLLKFICLGFWGPWSGIFMSECHKN